MFTLATCTHFALQINKACMRVVIYFFFSAPTWLRRVLARMMIHISEAPRGEKYMYIYHEILLGDQYRIIMIEYKKC